MAKDKVQVPSADRARIETLQTEIGTRLQEIAAIEVRVMSDKDATFAKRAKGKHAKAIRIRAGRKPPAANLKEDDMTFTMGPLCISYGSGPGMAICYDDEKGECYLDDGF